MNPKDLDCAGEALAEAQALTASLLVDVEAGRLSDLDAAMQRRAECLHRFVEIVGPGASLDAALAEGVAELRRIEERLREAILAARGQALSALAGIRNTSSAPYRETLHGAQVLDRRL